MVNFIIPFVLLISTLEFLSVIEGQTTPHGTFMARVRESEQNSPSPVSETSVSTVDTTIEESTHPSRWLHDTFMASVRESEQNSTSPVTLNCENYEQEVCHGILSAYCKVAIKVIDTSRITNEYIIKNLTREAKLLSMLNHPNIVRLYETIQCGPVYYLVTELATGGDLCSHVRNQPERRLSETMARSYTRQLAAALRYMHSRDIVHRDLKMENVILQDDKKERIKIIDFGLSNRYDDVNPLKTQCGSPEYAAPELFVKGKKYGPEVDLWSLGVIVYVMGAGRLPFASPHDDGMTAEERRRRLLAQIGRGLGHHQERAIQSLSAEYRDLVARLLTPVAQRRIGVRELCRHPWLVTEESADWLDDEEGLDDVDQDKIIDELISVTVLDRQLIEMDVASKRFGKLGGMYNIIAHEMQSNNVRAMFRKQRCSAIQTFKRNLNRTLMNANNNRKKIMQNQLKRAQCVDENVLAKVKLIDSFSIVQYDQSPKKITQLPVRNRIASKKSGSSISPTSLSSTKSKDTNPKKTDGRPMTQPCSKPISRPVASLQKHFLRPFSEQLGKIRNTKTNVDLRSKKCSQPEKSVIIPKASGQGVRTAMRYPPPAAGTSRRSPSASDTAATATAAVTAASVGQCDDRAAARRRSAPLGLARSKTDKTAKNATDLTGGVRPVAKIKSTTDKETSGVRYQLRKPQSIMKSYNNKPK